MATHRPCWMILLKTMAVFCITGRALLSLAEAPTTRAVAPATQTTQPSKIDLSYNTLSRYFTEYDKNGAPAFKQYEGNAGVLEALVNDIHIVNENASIATEMNAVTFAVTSHAGNAKFSKCQIVTIRFDSFGLYDKVFTVNEKWQIVVAEDGTLAGLSRQK